MNIVIIPCVVGSAMTRRCINSVLDQDILVTPFVIDNGSRDCGPLLRSYGKRISLVTYADTLSLNHIWNEALKVAFDSLKLDHALVINNDVVLRPDTYRLLLEDGGQFVTGVSVGTMRDTQHVNPGDKSPHPSFSCFLIRQSVWRTVGQFDERYWAWASDGDYHLRTDRAGIDAYAIDVPFCHEVSGTLKQMDSRTREMMCKRADADRQTFIEQHGFAIGSDEYYASFRHARDNKYVATGRL